LTKTSRRGGNGFDSAAASCSSRSLALTSSVAQRNERRWPLIMMSMRLRPGLISRTEPAPAPRLGLVIGLTFDQTLLHDRVDAAIDAGVVEAGIDEIQPLGKLVEERELAHDECGQLIRRAWLRRGP
jgi:hypothetical protein